ncbi:sulfotransferase family protein [Rhodoligotrophos defluvii]|uniref:sulfotransferase family protein n=1 Tax=Rhodoligotrophos defluvii TaxID=2561934 RepID=UPI0010CA1B17|nr:sulfotransferase [Rhodoligotrophos defluvii]
MTLDDIGFLIIGATKSATTWLQRALQRDPAVSMPDPELHYFSRFHERGHDWYLAQFHKGLETRLLGEKSNSYLESADAARRIARALPNVRLIAQLRNPVDRAYSDYCMMYRRGEVGRNIGAYLDPRNPQDTRLLRAGYYFEQLKAFYDHFPADRIHVTFYETVASDPAGHLAAVRRFLSLNEEVSLGGVDAKVKDKTAPMLAPALRRWLAPVKPVVAPMRQTALFRGVHRVLASEIRYSPLSDSLRRRLEEHYAADVERLGRLVGRDLSQWLNSAKGSRSGGQAFP